MFLHVIKTMVGYTRIGNEWVGFIVGGSRDEFVEHGKKRMLPRIS